MTLSREFRFITHTHTSVGVPIHSLGCHPMSPRHGSQWMDRKRPTQTSRTWQQRLESQGYRKAAMVRHKIRDGRAGATTRPRSSSATRWWLEILGGQVCRFLLPKKAPDPRCARVRNKKNKTPRVPEHSRVALRCLKFC